ncbi:adenosylcobinamide-GDP ribazoletransferase [Calidifontibacter sp. DB0510]|uniref:Adenosylcobinamide-GDP ribazoletransferase n=1 Tax=Metallococcus carri TaxID=1656884 RepID=A0A967AYC3_9MICO|nr:adenosylcobinamide-GDP ribazoletransferase [Metallococcus carri]NHN54684.1 adenosylcobinamide-GDP ribazoletransferase [Metallococcus carri]NOP37029.1 adenosylcobinamide-GDP ribazoletransferase [Calidifontibacter sp. DB2511S]
MRDGLRLAVGTLTIVPTGQVAPITRDTAARAMVLAPVAALPVAIAAALMAAAGDFLGLPALLTAVLIVAANGLLTRGMHLDGLADTVDGFGAGWDRARALEVMRKGDVGPMGAVALVVFVVAQTVAIAACLDRPWGPLVIAAVIVTSRAACAIVCRAGVTPARSDGLGSPMAGAVPTAAALVVALTVTVVLACTVTPFWQGALAAAAGLGAAYLVERKATRVLGGVTGDVIGAAISVTETVILIVLAAKGWR